MKLLRLLPLFLVPLVLIGCQKESDVSKEKIYDVKAKVVSVEMDKKTVVLDHEDIPGFMKAMVMKFSVDKANMLEGIKAGDQVHGKIKVKPGDYLITELHKL